MRKVVVISHPLRASECEVFLGLEENRDLQTVICSANSVLKRANLPQGCEIVFYQERASFLFRKSGFSLFVNKVKSLLRGGSNSGVYIERLLQKIRERLTPYRGWLRIRKKGTEGDFSLSLNEKLFRVLYAVHEVEPISTIVAFDALELPTLLDFSASRGIDVSLR